MEGRWELIGEQWLLVEPVLQPASSGVRRGELGTTIVADSSLPFVVAVESASQEECHLVEDALAASFLGELPARSVGDTAYDSDGLERKLAEDYGIEMNALNRRNRSKAQDGRALRRYKERWGIEWFLRMGTQLPQARNPMRVPRQKLPRNGSPRMPAHDARIFMRPLLAPNQGLRTSTPQPLPCRATPQQDKQSRLGHSL
jgi:hypothetical protein